MRLILALILFASVAVGQEKFTPKWDNWQVFSISKFIDSVSVPPDSVIFQRLLNERSIGVFLNLYSRYRKVCHDDSTAEQVGSGNAIVYPTNPPRIRYDYYKVVWTHREPTFPGFILWLEKERNK